MNKQIAKNAKMARRHGRVRAKISGTELRPRLSVFKSNAGLYLQLINDEQGLTLVSAHSREIKADSKKKKTDISLELGKLLAQKALAKKIQTVVFDRGSYRYHGRVKAVADGARDGGLQF
ncbi:50S ribosomal protein L18 [Candidatus Falkowbacteria bacterium CG_4_10_14_0_2_um_filter_41_15]|uniref:Large ribosomal subunit protein uL18 n=4 Tax=Candidatus Falkowiibacteriota TaxID=1752728 RepID=A0A2G9ZMH4_9BACT|nr:MAG: 50S ribosomal protein L18 [Candidatus Falkowbacteria bacterium CG1_02_41_21]PIP34301.1 MAG: 50S ribosomal protein L18 [Candidatus Falkowbacteria bacterium CG23_combo_of_CG06-09_8_20_14_all_41_10]PJA10067.1 MAG: 50S ribosomal protein L18 [Candidatus Falkowbacteria bacterium CG_4_10_14_0_2_um_filter_41_15]